MNTPVLHNSFTKHSLLKEKLLKLIDSSNAKSLIDTQGYDKISKVDWDQRNDWYRKWVQLLLPELQEYFNLEIKKLGISNVKMSALWFQQYLKNDRHGWHIHGDTFTGVYYLEFNNKSPSTEILEPITNKPINLKVKEGDIIIFPSFIIHRAIENQTSTRKTIISFNLCAQNIEPNKLKEIQ
jgi:uncharacterized RmlC-like cupin family protein|tara:strand:- start:1544 stop:2089 length:546 start_codon:yes stop_codon:yes gene_type:complete